MIEIRWHGRGGQGAVTSVEMFALAAIEEDLYGQGFPSFGPERRGAPVIAFNRIDKSHIKIKSSVYAPDYVVVLDPSLMRIVDITGGMKDGGTLIVNTPKTPEEVKKELGFDGNVATVDAQRIAWDELGVPITNTTMLGAVIKVTGLVDIKSAYKPLENRFGRLAAKNKKAMERAAQEVKLN